MGSVDLAFNQVLIFLPTLVVVAVTIAGTARMLYMRVKTISGRDVPLRFYVAFQGAAEPEPTAISARHYANMFESPVLFYAAVVSAFVLEAVGESLYFTAWTYALARLAQSTIHLTYNNVRHRALAFVVGWCALAALWLQIALAVFARL